MSYRIVWTCSRCNADADPGDASRFKAEAGPLRGSFPASLLVLCGSCREQFESWLRSGGWEPFVVDTAAPEKLLRALVQAGWSPPAEAEADTRQARKLANIAASHGWAPPASDPDKIRP